MTTDEQAATIAELRERVKELEATVERQRKRAAAVEHTAGQNIKELEGYDDRLEAAERALAEMQTLNNKFRESIDSLIKERNEAEAQRDVLRRSLENMLLAVCGDGGFADAIRRASGAEYPWPSLDFAEEKARKALATLPALPASAARHRAVVEAAKKIVGPHGSVVAAYWDEFCAAVAALGEEG